MIASYLHNFIFIKTKKTGGSTVEAVLAQHCGPDDVIAPLGPDDELARGNGQPLCRNFSKNPELERRMIKAILNRNMEALLKVRKRCDFYSHMTATEIKDKLSPEFWQKSYKITVERDPYEKAVSGAFFTYRSRLGKFEDHLDNFLRGGLYRGFPFYTIDEVPVVDDILRQESLQQDLARVGQKLGIPIPEELPRLKSRKRQDRRPAREILSDAQKEIVYRHCRQEFDLLGYTP